MKRNGGILLLICLITARPLTAQQNNTTLPPGLDAYISKVLQTFETPGTGIAIVKDGKVTLAKGYGVKKLGAADQVDARTLFAIASNSKVFTATALTMLVEEGKIKWNDPIVDHLPWFRMSDSYVTAHMTIRDLLIHHSGIPAYAGDLLLFPPSDYSREEIVRRIRHIPLVHEFRTVYAYDNILYLAAGELIRAVSGMDWETFIKTRIFDKVGMQTSISRSSTFKDQTDKATGHFRYDGKVVIIKDFAGQAIGDAGDPAGGIASNAEDMAKWLIALLDSGKTTTGEKLFTTAGAEELSKIVRPIPISKIAAAIAPAQMNFFGYALGLRSYNYGKYKVIGHGGKLDGFVSQIALVPDLKLGICVLTNQESEGVYWSVIYHILDHYMHNPSFDWIKGYKSIADSGRVRLLNAQKKSIIKQDTAAKESLPLQKYAGLYNDVLYGNISIIQESQGLLLRFDHSPQLIADMKHFHHDTFIASFRNKDFKADAYVTFALQPDNTIDQVKLRIIDPDSDLSFSELLLRPVKENKTN